MNIISLHDPSPTDVTFFIGPVGAPPRFKKLFQEAIEQSAAGNTEPRDRLIEIQICALQGLAEGTGTDPSFLKELIESLIESEIGNYSVLVSKGYIKKTWTPIFTIYLDRLTGTDGSPIGHLLTKRHGEVVADVLGQTFEADWVYTSWVSRTPIKWNSELSNIKEC